MTPSEVHGDWDMMLVNKVDIYVGKAWEKMLLWCNFKLENVVMAFEQTCFAWMETYRLLGPKEQLSAT